MSAFDVCEAFPVDVYNVNTQSHDLVSGAFSRIHVRGNHLQHIYIFQVWNAWSASIPPLRNGPFFLVDIFFTIFRVNTLDGT